MIFVDNNLSN